MINNSDSILATTSEIASMVRVDFDANANSNANVNKETILEFCTRIGQLSLELSQINRRLDNALPWHNRDQINSEKSRVINEINELSAKIGELTKQMSLQESSNTNVVLDEDTEDTGDVAKEPVSLSVTPITNNESNVKEKQKKEQEKEQEKEERPLKQVKFPTKVESVTFKASITITKKEGKVNTTTMSIDDTFKGSSIQDLINTLKEWLSDDSILVENMEYGVKEFTIKLEPPFSNNWSETSINLNIHTGNSKAITKMKINDQDTLEQHKEAFKKRFSEIIFMLEMLDY